MVSIHWTIDHDMNHLAGCWFLFVATLVHSFSSLDTEQKSDRFPSVFPRIRKQVFSFPYILHFTKFRIPLLLSQYQDLSYTGP